MKDCGTHFGRSGTHQRRENDEQIVFDALPLQEVLAEAQFDQMEKLLRAPERSMNERAAFCRQMAERANTSGANDDENRWRTASVQAIARAHELRESDQIEQRIRWIS